MFASEACFSTKHCTLQRKTIEIKRKNKTKNLRSYFLFKFFFVCFGRSDHSYVLSQLLLRFFLSFFQMILHLYHQIFRIYAFLSSSKAQPASFACVINTLCLATNISVGSCRFFRFVSFKMFHDFLGVFRR